MGQEPKTVKSRRRATRAAVAMLVIAGAVAVPALALGSATANTKSFADTRGESFAAPDIVSTTVSNTDSGYLRFAITVSNRPVFGRDMFVDVFLDTVKGGDSDLNGADYVIQLESGAPQLYKWNGNDFVYTYPNGDLGYRYTQTGPVFELNSTALGSPKRFAFREVVASGVTRNGVGEPVYANAKTDLSPNDPAKTFAYELVTHIRLTATKAMVSPAKPKAGGALAVVLPVAATDTGPLTKGTVVCAAQVGGKPLAVQSKVVASGVATCGFKLPAGTKGKTVKGTISVTTRGMSVKRSFSALVG